MTGAVRGSMEVANPAVGRPTVMSNGETPRFHGCTSDAAGIEPGDRNAPRVARAQVEAPAVLLRVTGTVQGVGFRPFVHRLAVRHGLTGWIRNESGAVAILAQGEHEVLQLFLEELGAHRPPLARIDEIRATPATRSGSSRFEILPSAVDSGVPAGATIVAPDAAICPECAREIFDPAGRRYRHAFATCCDCGPRYTVVEEMPYDRGRTTMRAFTPCPRCLAEYEDPSDRRYHSESNSCPACGPRVWLTAVAGATGAGELGRTGPSTPGEDDPTGEDAIRAAAERLIDGGILAVRGLGGFHLAVDATRDDAVRRLRMRKGREAKPFAVMVPDLDAARRLGTVDETEARLLTSPERPIVLIHARPIADLSPAVAPGLGFVGVMLAGTPLHLLLLDAVRRPLVMTSGNRSETPIAASNAEALARLADVADDFLLHDREIVARCDDSVVHAVGPTTVLVRRARGYAPSPLTLPIATPIPLLAVGPQQKSTFALARERHAYVSPHLGDLDNVETLENFRDTLDRHRRLFRVEPEVVVHDLHPGYLSTRIALETPASRRIAVQHHHAHIAAVAAEHGVTDSVVGVALDGTGHGDDDHVWGAEVLIADLRQYRRVARLRYAPLPGGDLAARHPWRSALGYLSLEPDAESAFARAFVTAPAPEVRLARAQIGRRLNTPLASSMGRLFDAAAAVLGVRTSTDYEGQAAMELESLAGARPARSWDLPIAADGPIRVLDPLPLLTGLGERLARGENVRDLAAVFHESVAAAIATLAVAACDESGLRTVALGGGSFQNARLLAGVRDRLRARGLTVLIPCRLPPNDGAISFGQAAIASALLAADGS